MKWKMLEKGDFLSRRYVTKIKSSWTLKECCLAFFCVLDGAARHFVTRCRCRHRHWVTCLSAQPHPHPQSQPPCWGWIWGVTAHSTVRSPWGLWNDKSAPVWGFNPVGSTRLSDRNCFPFPFVLIAVTCIALTCTVFTLKMPSDPRLSFLGDWSLFPLISVTCSHILLGAICLCSGEQSRFLEVLWVSSSSRTVQSHTHEPPLTVAGSPARMFPRPTLLSVWCKCWVGLTLVCIWKYYLWLPAFKLYQSVLNASASQRYCFK